jgi:hypothetical protein
MTERPTHCAKCGRPHEAGFRAKLCDACVSPCELRRRLYARARAADKASRQVEHARRRQREREEPWSPQPWKSPYASVPWKGNQISHAN